MGTYTFKWNKPADEVYVTGTFDNWTKSEKLEKSGSGFEKTVTLPDSTEKILYKFVVDGNWVADDSAPTEKDSGGIDNNVLTPQDIIKAAPPTAGIMSTVGPGATTVGLAKDAPLESKSDKPEGLPGTFPETPAADLDKQFKVSPLPAAEGGINPIKLAPGEPVPKDVATNGINSHVKLDPESYNKADTLPGVSTELPPPTKNMIPESSLPIAGVNDAAISTVGPESTTLGLAAKVPEVVKESQEKAGFPAEASGIGSEVKEKEQLEEELLKKVPEAPSTSEGTAGKGTEKSENDKTIAETVTATAAGLGATALATAVATKDKAVEQVNATVPQATAAATNAAAKLPEPVKQSLPVSVQDSIATTTKEETRQEVSPEVPAEVKESIKEAGKSPEAAANTAAVEEKKAVEAELLKEVKPVDAVGETSNTNGADIAASKEKGAETPAPKEVETTAPKAPETPAKATSSTTPATTPAGTTPGSSKAAESPATTEKKKKNRLSMMINKIKHKVGSKDKA